MQGAAEDDARSQPISLPPDGSGETHVGTILGTPGYMSPEQAAGALGALGPASDVYSLGAILFEILTLAPLHRRGATDATLASTHAGAVARPSVRAPSAGVAPELEALCVRATAHDPRERFASARELSDAIERYLDGERDLARRAELSEAHALRAREHADRAHVSGDLDERRRAVQEAGRALGLDPTNERAMAAVVELLATPPPTLPPEIQEQIAHDSGQRIRRLGWIGGVTYVMMLAYLPLLLWLGVRDWAIVGGFYACMLGAAAISWAAYFSRRPTDRHVVACMLMSNLGFGLASMFFGPLLVVPAAIATNTTAFVIHLGRRLQWLTVACSCVAVIAPMVLELAGILPRSYAFGEGGMLIRPHATALPETATLVVLGVSAVVGVLMGTVVVAEVRESLSVAERALLLQQWHLRELLPAATRQDR